MGSERNAVWYNKIFRESVKYHQFLWKDFPIYNNLWRTSIEILKDVGITSVFDIGCGMGHFGEACKDAGISYRGIDFSSYAIDQSRKKLPEFTFEVADILEYDYPEAEAFVCQEVLEHINQDLHLFARLPRKPFLFTVPNHDSRGHVRFFSSVQEVEERYSPFLDELQVEQITQNHFLGFGIVSKEQGK